MKIGKLKLAYFKRFRELELDFYDEAGQPRNLVVLVGDNGAGKTTVLQAIALTLGTATNRFKEPEELDWPGFEAELAHEGWRIPPNIPSVECEVVFDRDELAAIQECFERTRMFGDPKFIPPGNEQTTTLCYFANGKVDARTPPAFFQFRGRDYAKQVLSQHPEGRDVFKRLGGVFWYTQHRTATSLTPWQSENSMLSTDLLRQRLSEWQNIHLQVTQKTHSLKPHQRDLYAELAETYKRFFPDRSFVGTTPREPEDVAQTSWFLLSQGNMQYEISEMSAGERAIFPLIFDFVNWNIHRSIILIDEIELHLHPPLQQALVRGLRELGTDNQFIITTHSESVFDAVPPSSIHRLKG